MQNLSVKSQLRTDKPVHEVFEAIVDPAKMTGYFISSSSGRMEPGKTLRWAFAEFGVEFDIKVQRIEKDRFVSFTWDAGGAEGLVEMTLAPVAGGTLVVITEGSWPPDEKGIALALGQMRGWTHFLCCLKAYLEHGINLRKGGVGKGLSD